MYKKFFGLSRNPFDLTPDPAFFVSTKRHNEALATLSYGVRCHKGFVVITGEVGTGKTLLLRCLLRLLKESQDVSYAYLFNCRLTDTEFLQYILSDFGLPASGKNKSELLLEFSQFLITRGVKKLTTVLIVDEAHHLSEELLEEIRLLSDLETNNDKLLQIVLVGQPELDETLDSTRMRQLKQRIALRAHLGPLSFEETREYIAERLRIAGAEAQGSGIFCAEAIESVYSHSGGLPRLVNSICENALITAYTRRSTTVTADIIDDVLRELRVDVTISESDRVKSQSEAEIERAASLLREIFAYVSKPSTRKPELGSCRGGTEQA